jgi:hypothetical protein
MSMDAENALAHGTSTDALPGADPGGGGSALLGRAGVLIWNDIAPEGREQFYAWHDNEHMPERLALPGFRRGRRLACAGHSPEWLTMYEADDVGALTSREYLARLNAPTPATSAALKHFRNTSRAVCRIACSMGSSTGGHVLALRLSVVPAQADAMCRYLRDEAFPAAMERTGVVACHLYQAHASASFVNTAESSTREFDVPAWVVLCEASMAAAAAAARQTIEGPALRRLGVIVREDAAVYALEICRLAATPRHRVQAGNVAAD